MHRLPLLVLGWLLAAAAWAQDVLPVPALSGRVIDQTATLGEAQRSALEAKLAAFEQSAGTQIVVLIVPTTQPEDISAYAQRVADTWKIGRREVGDGLLLLVAKNDRRLRIEVAKTLEGAVPDLAARQIIDRQISPAFKAGDFAAGLDKGVDALIARIKGENLPVPEAPGVGGDNGAQWEELAMFFFIAVFVAGGILTQLLGRKLAMLVTGGGAGAAAWLLGAGVGIAIVAALLATIMVGALSVARAARRIQRSSGRVGMPPGGFGGGGWGGGGGGFGGGSGGFGSGGGGDFGGGGASGDW